jgi:hypothetical protein
MPFFGSLLNAAIVSVFASTKKMDATQHNAMRRKKRGEDLGRRIQGRL